MKTRGKIHLGDKNAPLQDYGHKYFQLGAKFSSQLYNFPWNIAFAAPTYVCVEYAACFHIFQKAWYVATNTETTFAANKLKFVIK